MEAPDYRAAALAAVEAAEKETPVSADPVPEVKPPVSADPVADPAKVEVPKTEEVKKVEEPPKGRFEKSFEDLVREKAEIRKAKDELKAREGSLTRDQKIMEAVKSGDPAAILAAAGVKFDPTKAIEVKAEDPVQSLAEQVKELKDQLAQKTRAENRNNVLGQMRALTAKETAKFPYVSALGEEDNALAYVDRYWAENQELPVPGDLQASMELALEATENRLRKEAERYKKVSAGLTTDPAATKKEAAQVVPPAVSNTSKTLTHSSGGGPKAVAPDKQPVRKTSEDYRREAIALMESEG